MATFNLSVTLGGTTRTRNGVASAGDLTRFVAALRSKYPATASDNAAVDALLSDFVAWCKDITKQQEQLAALAASVNTIQPIDVT